MKILLGCLNVNGLGGSEMYHYELARELTEAGHDIDLFTFGNIDVTDNTRIKLNNLGINQIDLRTIDANQKYDIIVVSQPDMTQFILKTFNNIPIISIIHSEVRAETPIVDARISHYIGIRQSIVDMLITDYKIAEEKVSLIYNPIDRTRFNSLDKKSSDKTKGIFVGEVLDPIRFPSIAHLVQSCIENDWELLLMSRSQYNFNHPNIKYIDQRWHTEEIVKQVDFTGGILLGRTTLEGLCCGIPGYTYLINANGDINAIELVEPNNMPELCDSKHVVNEHINLYKKIISNSFNVNSNA